MKNKKIKIDFGNLFLKFIENLRNGIINVVQLFNETNMSLYSANAAFFLITTAIPLFMLLFSSFSLISYVNMDDLISNIQLLFPNLPYVKQIITKLLDIAHSLATKDVVSINIIIALFTGSSALYSFTIGIRKIHNIDHSSNFIKLKLLSFINMFVFFIAIIIMLIAFILGSMILRLVTIYLPIAEPLINKILSFRYLVAIIVIFVFLLSIYATSTNFERSIKNNLFGAITATALWLIVSRLFSIYFTYFPLNDGVYGSLTGVVVILFWLYACMNIIFLGAVINEVFIPQKRILEKQKEYIMNELKANNLQPVDNIINKIYKSTKIKKKN